MKEVSRMRVVDLAKQLNLSDDIILSKLKALKLKAKGSDQELNVAVVSLLKSELRKEASQAKTLTSKEPSTKEVPITKEPLKAKEIKEEKKEKELKFSKIAKKQEEGKKEAVQTTIKKKAQVIEAKREAKITVPKPISKEIKKAEIIESRPKHKISTQPFVTLKPLPQKRRKKGISEKTPGEEGHQPSATIAVEAPSKVKPEAPAKKFPEKAGVDISKSAQEISSLETVSIPTKDITELKPLEVRSPITVKDLAVRLQEKSSIVLKKLMQMGILAHINQSLDEEIVRKLAVEFGYNLTQVKTQEQQLIEIHKLEQEDPKLLKPRPPVVTFMGHVDHGKTSLLDRIRKSRVADSEHGGITQQIGAYSVNLPKGRITFLDTPGHEAFTAMRARGAHITDLVVLVVAVDEGVMPQTEEALAHARAANVPLVVALNKIDKRDIDIDRVKKQLADLGLNPEDWGGKTIVANVSAVTGEGIDHLLEMILLEAELLELKANYNKKASGIVVDAQLSRGKGVIADLIVQSGILKEGNIIVVGPCYGKVKAMFDDHERLIKEAGPSMPVQVLGLPEVPEAGEMFYVVEDERQAREITLRRQQQIKNEKLFAKHRISLEDLYIQIQEGKIQELNVILKADVQGSLEALRDSLDKIPSDEVKLKFIHMGIGDINLSDVLLAIASKAVILGFHVAVEPRAKEELERNPVEIRQYRIIYDAVNDVKNALEGLLEPKTKKKFLSRIEVRQVLKLSKGIVAGCYVQKGRVHRKDHVDVVRNGSVVFSGTISSLKRFKDDVRDVGEGMECGLIIHGFDQIQVGDILETYELEQIARKLSE